MNLFSAVTTVDWGFDASDIFTNGVALFGFLAGFVLLGLAIKFAPKLVEMVKGAVG